MEKSGKVLRFGKNLLSEEEAERLYFSGKNYIFVDYKIYIIDWNCCYGVHIRKTYCYLGTFPLAFLAKTEEESKREIDRLVEMKLLREV